MALSSQLRSSGSQMAAIVRDSVRNGFALGGRTPEVYSEEAFQHVLAIERKRAIFAKTSLLLLLVRLRNESGGRVEIPRSVAGLLFSGLGHCFREVDFVGWLREGRVAGAVLAQGPVAPDDEAVPRIVQRVTQLLSRRLPLPAAHRLDVRVVRLGRGVA